ncbi:MAG: FAD-dependent oxidoreductase [Parcubacteria group bacterium]|nr:FAD-dependent oxidoreductase [Parcubacteria group bacterium]
MVIVGASAAGLSASVYAARRRLNFKIITGDIGGEVATSGEIENWPGVIHTTGIELADQFKAHALTNKVVIEEGKWVKQLAREGNFFVVSGNSADGSSFQDKAKVVLISTGVHPRELNVPGEKEFRNKGLSYCTVCDGPLFAGQIVATIGGGNSVLESAIMLAGIASKVYVVNKNPKFKGEQVLIDKVSGLANVEIIYEAMTQSILGDKFVKALEYRDKSGQVRKLEVGGVFVHIGQTPNSSFVEGVELNEFKEIKVDLVGRTNMPGLFAAGDVTNMPHKQIVIAAGQGVAAVLTAVEYLNRNH